VPHETFERGRLRIDFDTYEVSVDDAGGAALDPE
jgi:hypothetical protein